MTGEERGWKMADEERGWIWWVKKKKVGKVGGEERGG